MLRARRIDLDQVATAYCWEEKLNLAKRPAMAQLVKQLVIHLQELQDQYNDSNKATASDKKDSKQPSGLVADTDQAEQQNPASPIIPKPGCHDAYSAHRISDLEAKLASALETVEALRASATSGNCPAQKDSGSLPSPPAASQQNATPRRIRNEARNNHRSKVRGSRIILPECIPSLVLGGLAP